MIYPLQNRRNSFFISSIILLLFFPAGLFCQFFISGTAATSIKWNQLNTPYAKIIYPQNAYSMANSFANYLDNSAPLTAEDLKHKIKKPIKVVIYNQNVLSNGYVSWAPRRMEIISVPPQESYAQPWLQQLALHEYRHVVQIDKLNQGFTRGLSFLTGELSIGGVSAFFPLWFLEGDAVANETALSNNGRGREPSFDMEIRTLELQQTRRFTYDQSYLGTYKTSLPNHYQYGYQMVSWLRMNYGGDVLPKLIDRIAKQPYSIAPFYLELKHRTGLSKLSLYDSTLNFLHRKWEKESVNIKSDFSEEIKTVYKSDFVNYRFPCESDDGSIYAVRSSVDETYKLVKLKDNNEEILYSLGNFNSSQLAYSGKYIAWEELRYDPRWEQHNYSVIKLYDIETKHSEIFLSKEHHFAPAISNSSDKLAVINIDELNNYWIDVYAIKSKLLIERYPAEGTTQLSSLAWLGDSVLVTVVINEKGNSIYSINLKRKTWENLSHNTYNSISNLTVTGNQLFYTGTYDGKQNIYSFDTVTRAIYKLTSSKTGATFGRLNAISKNLLFSEYSVNGYRIKKIPADSLKSQPLIVIPRYNYILAESLSNATANKQNADSVKLLISYPSKKYNKALHAFNFHSWLLPFYFDIDNIMQTFTFEQNVYPGFNLFSQNMLSTVISSFGYYYKNGYHYFNPWILIKSFYPVISMDITIGGPPYVRKADNSITINANNLSNYYILRSKISLPLNFSTARITCKITPGVRFTYENSFVASTKNFESKKIIIDNIYYYKGIFTANLEMSFFLYSKMAYRDIYPRWGINIYASSLNEVSENPYGESWESNLVYGSLYLPGMLQNHSIKLKAAVEKGWRNWLSVPRGYNKEDINSIRSSKFASVEYSFPVIYPDLSIGPIAYLKRLHANVFYDFMNLETFRKVNNNYQFYFTNLASTGIELGVETHFFRFFIPFTPAFKYNYRINDWESRFGFNIYTSYAFSLGQHFVSRTKP